MTNGQPLLTIRRKRMIFFILSMVLVFSLAACDTQGPTDKTQPPHSEPTSAPIADNTENSVPKETMPGTESGEGENNEQQTPALCMHSHTTLTGYKQSLCAESGYSGDTYCIDCETVIAAGQVVPATGHNHVEVQNKVDATCTAAGYSGDTYCKDCGILLAEGAIVDATGHSMRLVHVKEVSCTEDGYTGDTYCDYCQTTFSKGSVMEATGHGETELKNLREATCTAGGYTGDTYCTVCNQPISTGEHTQPNGHTEPVLVGYVAVTDDADGYTGDWVCANCNHVFEYGWIIPKPALTTRYIHEGDRVYEFTYMSGQSPFDYTLAHNTKTVAHTSLESMEIALLKRVNEERVRRGLPQLQWEERAYFCTKARTLEYFECHDFNRPDGRNWYTVYYDAGIYLETAYESRFTSEHIRTHFPTDESIVQRICEIWCRSDSLLMREDIVYISICVEEIGDSFCGTYHIFGYEEDA